MWTTVLHLRCIASFGTLCSISTVFFLMHIHFMSASTFYNSENIGKIDLHYFKEDYRFMSYGRQFKGTQNKKNNKKTLNEKRMSDTTPLVRLYTMKDIVTCFDSLYLKNLQRIHISFIGDSLIRNQFRNFITTFPDYDRQIVHNETNVDVQSKFHEDRNMTSLVLNDLLISFRWRAIINGDLISDFKLWARQKEHQTPDIIFLGCTAHNMLKKLYNLTDQSFPDIVEKQLFPALLNYLNVHRNKQVFWIIQNPTKDLLGPISYPSYNDIIHLKKINDYNSILRRTFSGTRVATWDSLNSAIEENIRSCYLQRFQRFDKNAHQLCGDYLHIGHQVLSIGSQIIFNHMCNHS